MAPTTCNNGKNHMTSELEMLEDRICCMEESMVTMTSLVETLIQSRSQPPLLTDTEQADVLRARLRADNKDAAVEQGARGTTAAARDRDSSGESTHEARNPRSRRTAAVNRPAAHSVGVWLPTDQAGPSRSATEEGGTLAQPNSIFERLEPYPP